MAKADYVSPRISWVGTFRGVTNGVWFGKWRDIFGGRAFINVQVG